MVVTAMVCYIVVKLGPLQSYYIAGFVEGYKYTGT